MKAKSDVGSSEQVQALPIMTKRKGNFGNLVLIKRRRICQKSNAMVIKNMGTTREIVQHSRNTIGKEMKPISPKKWKNTRRRNQRMRK